MSDFRGECSLVLFFAHGLECRACLVALENFARQNDELKDEGARLIVIFPEPLSRLEQFLATEPVLDELPHVLLCDENSSIRQMYAGLMDESLIPPDHAALFVLDSFGAPYAALVSRELDDTQVQAEVLKWLEFIGLQCPE